MSRLVAKGLKVRRKGEAVLRLPDLSLEAGQCLDLKGPSGSGKTNLLRAIAGLAPLASGQIENGFERIGFAFQDNRLIPHLSARENVLFCCGHASQYRVSSRLEDAFSDLGLSEQADQRASNLSGGEAQRVNLLRALCVEPDLLLLDEIGANVDDQSWDLISAFIGCHASKIPDCAIIQVAHNPLRRLCWANHVELCLSEVPQDA